MHLTVLTLSTCMLGHAAASRNITVDDYSDSPNLTYNNDTALWERWGTGGRAVYEWDVKYSYNESYLWSTDSNARAVFKFTGTAIYYLAPLFARQADVSLALDGEDFPTTVDLQDYSGLSEFGRGRPSMVSDVRWSRTDLHDGEHTLVITRGTNAFLDAFMYTQEETQEPIASEPTRTADSTSALATPTSGSTHPTETAETVASESTKTADSTSALAAPTSESTHPTETALSSRSKFTPAMIGGIVGGTISALLLVGIAFLVWRHKSRPMLTPLEAPAPNQPLTSLMTPFTGYGSWPHNQQKSRARPQHQSKGSVVNISVFDAPPSYH